MEYDKKYDFYDKNRSKESTTISNYANELYYNFNISGLEEGVHEKSLPDGNKLFITKQGNNSNYEVFDTKSGHTILSAKIEKPLSSKDNDIWTVQVYNTNNSKIDEFSVKGVSKK